MGKDWQRTVSLLKCQRGRHCLYSPPNACTEAIALNRTLVLAALCAVLGAFIGIGVTRMLAQRHQHTHAVMWLAEYHLQQLSAATTAPGSSCQGVARDIDSLRQLQRELVWAFPLAYQQDQEFRQRADALGKALNSNCSTTAALVKAVSEACDNCHREYR